MTVPMHRANPSVAMSAVLCVLASFALLLIGALEGAILAVLVMGIIGIIIRTQFAKKDM